MQAQIWALYTYNTVQWKGTRNVTASRKSQIRGWVGIELWFASHDHGGCRKAAAGKGPVRYSAIKTPSHAGVATSSGRSTEPDGRTEGSLWPSMQPLYRTKR